MELWIGAAKTTVHMLRTIEKAKVKDRMYDGKDQHISDEQSQN